MNDLRNSAVGFITVLRQDYCKDEMLKRNSLPFIGDREHLHYQGLAHELLCAIEIDADSAPDELRREVSGLISHEAVLIDPLPQ